MMKKLISFIIAVLLITHCSVVITRASEMPKVEISEFIKTDTDSYLMVVDIKNNPGLMGFKMSISYGDGVEINSISRGEITGKGTFSDNHEIHRKDNFFDVLWNYSKEIKDDGKIFIIGISINEKKEQEIKFDISYSRPDTFNENYEDVILECEDFVINEKQPTNIVPKKEDAYFKTAKRENDIGIIKNEIEKKNVVSIVNDFIKDKNIEKISESDKEKIVKNFFDNKEKQNRDINILNDLGTDKVFQTIKQAYKVQIEAVKEADAAEDKNDIVGQSKNNDFFTGLSLKEIIMMILVGFIIVIIIFTVKRERYKHYEKK